MVFDFSRDAVCSFTGHRDLPPEKRDALRSLLRRTLRTLALDRGMSVFLTGGAMGFDRMAAEEVLALRERYGGIRLFLFLPFPGYDAKWPRGERAALADLLKKADGYYALITFTSEPGFCAADAYYPGVYFARDRMLVNLSSVCVSYLEKTRGGTFYTVSYAKDAGIEVIPLANRIAGRYNDPGTDA